MPKIQATNNFVFIIREEEKKEIGGLIIPSHGRKKTHKGVIYSVGDLVQDDKIKNGEGNICLWHEGVGFTIEYDNTEYLVLSGEEIIAILW